MSGMESSPLTMDDLASLNYTVLVPYNGTEATGGDSLTMDLNVYYQVSDIRERG